MPTKENILRALSNVSLPNGADVASRGMISGITLREGGRVGFVITIQPEEKETMAHLVDACQQAVEKLPGVSHVTAVLTAQGAEPIAPNPKAGYDNPRARAQWNLTPLENVNRVIAVASGKGGVGKSTTTVNLAHALQESGKRVGILDADIYGPSIPRMMKLAGQPTIHEGKMQPLVNYGIACNSMGFITGDEAAILRGPMISKSLQQLLRMTAWATPQEPLDYLLVDMPPGTGDIHLSMAQQVPLSGAIIVTTPQQVAITDARKCAAMFQKMNVPILGVVENMSYLIDSSGAKVNIFGAGGGATLAKEFSVPLLAQIPLDMKIGAAADAGQKFVAPIYIEIAKQL